MCMGIMGRKSNFITDRNKDRGVIPERVKFITRVYARNITSLASMANKGDESETSVVGNSFRLSIDHEQTGITNGERDKKHRLLMAQFSYR